MMKPLKKKVTLLLLALVMMGLACFAQDTDYSGKYKVVSSQGGELEVNQNGSTATINYKGDSYECEVNGKRISGNAKQPRNYVGRYAKCYDQIMANPEKARLFRKYLSISFDEIYISGMTQAPLFECSDNGNARILEGDIKLLALSYRSNDLLWITKTKIYRCNVDEPTQRVEVISGLSKGSNIAIDQKDNLLFYSDGSEIWSANLDGGERKKIISSVAGPDITHFALDTKRNTLFWSSGKYIYRFDYPNGNIKSMRLSAQLEKVPDRIVIDSKNEQIIWTAKNTSTIYRSNLFGRDQMSFATDSNNNITIDQNERIIYSGGYLGVTKINIDSRQKETVVSESDFESKNLILPKHYFFDAEYDRLYFVNRDKLYKILKKREHQIQKGKIEGMTDVQGLALVSNRPIIETDDSDEEFDIWTLIRIR